MEISTPRLVTPGSSAKHLSITLGSRVLKSPLSDDAIWKRLRDAGFDEESIKQKDKAALVTYIAKLEAEMSQTGELQSTYLADITDCIQGRTSNNKNVS